MALNAEGYFSHIKACISPAYICDAGEGEAISIREKVYGVDGKPKTRKIDFAFTGRAFAVHLDLKTDKGQCPPLFRFLDDEAKPWAKRCDFVIFHQAATAVYAYLIECKSNSIAGADIREQLDAGMNWLWTLKKVIENYYGHQRTIKAQRFVFSTNSNPAAYLDAQGKYLKSDPAIRFYHYDQLAGLSLGELENSQIESV
jgi:hypothetical protein